MQGKSVEVLLLSFFTVLAKPCNILWLRGYTSSNYNMANNKLWYMIWYILYYIYQYKLYIMKYIFSSMTAGDVWDKLWGIAVGGGIRWIELLADVSSAFVKCFSAQNFYEPFPWTFTGNWTSIIFFIFCTPSPASARHSSSVVTTSFLVTLAVLYLPTWWWVITYTIFWISKEETGPKK